MGVAASRLRIEEDYGRIIRFCQSVGSVSVSTFAASASRHHGPLVLGPNAVVRKGGICFAKVGFGLVRDGGLGLGSLGIGALGLAPLRFGKLGFALVMDFQLRDYQVELVEAGASFLLDSRRKRGGLIIAPTGSGKSWIIAGIADRLDAPLLVFQPNREILLQNKSKMETYGFRPSVYSSSLGRHEASGDVVLATVGSVAARKGKTARASKADLFSDYPYILIDECHLCGAKGGMYKDFFDEIDARLCGLTATPFRLASNSMGSELRFLTRTRPRIFSDVIGWVQTGDLFSTGYLCPTEYYRVGRFQREQVAVNSTGADFSEKSLQLHLFEIGFNGQVIEVANRLLNAGRKNLLVFVRFVKDAEAIAAGISGAAVVTAETKTSERESIGNAFKNGAIQTVVNCGVYLLGFDHPELETVLDAAPSLSLARVYQKWGRVVRPHPRKKTAWVVDMCGGYNLFGRMQDLRLYCEKESLWSLWGKPGGPEHSEKQLTNVPLNGGGNGMRCKVCQSPKVFYSAHEVTRKSAMLSRPTGGMAATIVLRKVGDKTYYAYPKEGDKDAKDVEFVPHRLVCTGAQR